MPEVTYLQTVVALLRAHLAQLRRQDPEAGYSTETIIVIALLAAAALFAVGLIVQKIRATAGKIKTE